MAAKTMEFRVPTTVLVRKETTSALGDAQPSDKDPPKFRSAKSALLEETIQKIMSSSELGFLHILLDLWTINVEKLNQEWLTKSADPDQPPHQTGNSVWK